MEPSHLDAAAIRRALTLRDLSDPDQGAHAMQLVLTELEDALARAWNVPVRRRRAHPVVSIAQNYDRLRIAPDAVARDARYTRYVNDHAILRTHTSAMIPLAIEEIAHGSGGDVVLSCPGLVYRRDVVDRRHTGEPHQLDLWQIRTSGIALGVDDLREMVELVVRTALPGRRYRMIPATHPYTLDGAQVDVWDGESWIEVGECGLAHPDVLRTSGLAVPPASGLAIGLGLDRLVMMRKGIPDIRLLRSDDPRVGEQMLDLEPYRTVSTMPAMRRDLSIAVDEAESAETIADRARTALGEDADAIESLEIVAETPYETLPEAARARLGISSDQKNVLLRLVIRHLERTLSDAEANELCDKLLAALHEGSVPQATPSRAGRRKPTGRRKR